MWEKASVSRGDLSRSGFPFPFEILSCLMAGEAKMADLPEPAEKPDQPQANMCWVGYGSTKLCAASVSSVRWNKDVGFWLSLIHI